MNSLSAQRSKPYLIVAVAAMLAVLVVAANVLLVSVSALANVDEMRAELAGRSLEDAPPTWIDDWFWHQGAPFKYRILGKLPMWVGYEALQALGVPRDAAVYLSFVACSALFLFMALAMLGIFTRTFVRDLFGSPGARQGWMVECTAMGLLAISPPVLFFAKFAVHGSPNDFLGYFLMLATLHLAWTDRFSAATAVAALAVFCRETTLLAPFAVLFFTHVPIRRRLALLLVPIATLLSWHALWPGLYDPSPGAHLNIEFPRQTIAFVFLSFGPLWIFGLLGYGYLRKLDPERTPPAARALTTSFPFALLFTLGIVFLFARIREIRILYVLFIYFLPFSIAWLYGRRAQILALAGTRYFALWVVAALVLSFRIRVWLLPASALAHRQMESLWGVMFIAFIDDPHFSWIDVTVGYLLPCLICMPLIASGWRRLPGSAPAG